MADPNVYCLFCCVSYSTAVKFIGFSNMWAAIYFWAEFSRFPALYWPIQLVFALAYTLRVVAFLLMINKDSSDSRYFFYRTFSLTRIPIWAAIAAELLMLWVEWQFFPLWQFAFWLLVLWFNFYHTVYILKPF